MVQIEAKKELRYTVSQTVIMCTVIYQLSLYNKRTKKVTKKGGVFLWKFKLVWTGMKGIIIFGGKSAVAHTGNLSTHTKC